MAETILELINITKDFGSTKALTGINLTVAEGEFITLLGPSGCGKTTTLRIIAGLEEPTTGTVRLEGEEVTHLEPNKRDVNTVFQNYALFPHMDVAENIGYGQRIRKVDKAEIDKRVEEMLELVQLEGYGDRMPSQLSGGQKQRVAIARAVINRPKVLLLDEPLGALDLQLRHQLQEELKEIQRKLGITFVYITHDQEEALNLSDRIVVMKEGKFEQIGTPEEIYNEPESSYVAEFVGSANILKGKVVSSEDGFVTFQSENGRGMVRETTTRKVTSDNVTIAVRGEDVEVEKINQEDKPCFSGIVREKSFAGGSQHIVVELVSGQRIVSYHHGFDCPVVVGDTVCATWDPAAAILVNLGGM